MATAILKRPWLVAGAGGWSETIVFWFESIGTPDALAGYSAVLSLIRPGRPAAEALVYASTDTPAYVVLSGAQLAIDVPRAVTAAWTPGAYDVQLRVFNATDDFDRYTLVGPRRLVVIEAPGA